MTRRYVLNSLVVLTAVLGLYVTSRYSYPLFHTVAEIFSIVVMAAVFLIAWNARRFFLDNFYLLFLGVAFAFVSFIDLLHTLSYRGLDMLPQAGDANLPTQLWIAGRYMLSLSLLTSPFFIQRRTPIWRVFAVYAAATVLLLLSIFHWNIFPVCFIEGQPLPPFKIYSEYAICAILAAAGVLMYARRDRFDPHVLLFLLLAIGLMIAAELAFTYYISAYGFSNFVGHVLKVFAYYLLYKAIVEVGLTQPYRLLFRDLTQSREELATLNQSLEDRVAQRTAQIRHLASELAVAEHRERRRLARSLHDELAQILVVCKMRLSALRGAKSPQAQEQAATQLGEFLDEAIRYTRTLISELNPPMLDEEGLVAALRWLAQKMQAFGLDVQVDAQDTQPPLDAAQRTLLFQAAREMLMNVVKHAGVRQAHVSVLSEDHRVRLEVRDQGAGFDPRAMPQQPTDKGGFGLFHLRQQIQLLGGEFHLESAPGQGSHFTVTVPLKPAQPASA